MNTTLFLNADGQLINLLPLSSRTWQDAIKSTYIEVVEPLHYYEDWIVRSPSVVERIPAVVILKRQIKVKRNLQLLNNSPNAGLVFLRDRYTCQYCANRFRKDALTIDHVTPRKYGGGTTYENITTSCSPCNSSRGHNERIQPITRPTRPTYYQLINVMREFPITVPHVAWSYYMGWQEDRVMVADPRSEGSPKYINPDFYYG